MAVGSQNQCSCPDCGSTKQTTDDGVRYCDNCGVVLSETQIEHSEPRWKSAEDQRLGPQQSLQWINTGTSISYSPSYSKRFTQYNNRLTSKERSVVSGLHEIRGLSASVELPESMRERAAYWYRKAARENLLHGRSIEGLAAGCVYLAARERHHPITAERLEQHSPISAAKIRHHIQVIRMELSVTIPPAHPRDFLPLISSRLSLSPAVEQVAHRHLEWVTTDEYHVGKHPSAIAATMVYSAANEAGEKLTQQESPLLPMCLR